MTEEKTIRLEDLKEAWTRLDERIDVDIARMAAVTGMLAEDRARTLVRRAIWPPAMELVVTAAGALLVVVELFRSGSAVFLGSWIFVLALFAVLIARLALEEPLCAERRAERHGEKGCLR